MNSMNNLIDDIKSRFTTHGIETPKDNQVSFDFEMRDIHSALSYLKNAGFRQLSIISCIDWIEEGKFQLVFMLFNWEEGIRVQARCKIGREKPVFKTITSIYPGAQYYERDVHEFFGVEFEGNPNSYKQLFLENWDDMPPLRKDFDPQKYSDKKYPERKYKKDFSNKEAE